ncbi:MAG: 8-oxo-dGTP diphosphatase [Clostridia bacterium]|nr:8-oxo-dGTP diphosphatase [Clostridia bacterium]MBR3563549.1 8-oxo-dGTP diphosphatase [Clostridia bacterium]MBR6135692.1 8-oxo-dGTP diphosphatase [Clostridia bacterium]MBR6822975.1 8-oxo-dGTP diphosphatase [Clostridia bacterium]
MQNTTLCYIEKDGSYLMLLRNKKKDDLNEGKWIGVGGHFLEDESPEECLIREVREETGLTLNSFLLRSVVTFVSDKYETEQMFLYTSTDFSGELIDCDEGELRWIDKKEMYDIPLWEGDKIFLKLMDENQDYFALKLVYEGDDLRKAILNGKDITDIPFQSL